MKKYEKYDRYRKLRQETNEIIEKAKDASFELMNSVMTTGKASCVGEFALSTLLRRKWPSTLLMNRYKIIGQTETS